MYLCANCGNDESFDAVQQYTEWGSEDVTINNEGDIQDWGDREARDSETDSMDDITCQACQSSDIEDIDDEDEYEERKQEILIENGAEPEPSTNTKNWKGVIKGEMK